MVSVLCKEGIRLWCLQTFISVIDRMEPGILLAVRLNCKPILLVSQVIYQNVLINCGLQEEFWFRNSFPAKYAFLWEGILVILNRWHSQ